MTLCHRLKKDPQTRTIKVVIVSGKAFHADHQRALQYGADLFVEKPYDIAAFAAKIGDLLLKGPPPRPAAASISLFPEPAAAAQTKIHSTVWGCRSLSASKGDKMSLYGRASSCLSVETGGHFLIFDAGTGLNALGAELVKSGQHQTVWLFLSHFHQDNIEGL